MAPVLKKDLQAVAIMQSKPVFRSMQAVAESFVKETHLTISLLLDEDQSVQKKYVDMPMMVPFSILLDSNGRVRFVMRGRLQDDKGRGTLAGNLMKLFRQRGDKGSGLGQNEVSTGSALAPDGEVTLEDASKMRLSALWKNKPLIMTFVKRGCGACERRKRLLSRFARASKRFTLLTVNQVPRLGLTAREPLLDGWDESGHVFKNYDVDFVPYTVIVRDGRVIYTEISPTDDMGLELTLNELVLDDLRKEVKDDASRTDDVGTTSDASG